LFLPCNRHFDSQRWTVQEVCLSFFGRSFGAFFPCRFTPLPLRVLYFESFKVMQRPRLSNVFKVGDDPIRERPRVCYHSEPLAGSRPSSVCQALTISPFGLRGAVYPGSETANPYSDFFSFWQETSRLPPQDSRPTARARMFGLVNRRPPVTGVLPDAC